MFLWKLCKFFSIGYNNFSCRGKTNSNFYLRETVNPQPTLAEMPCEGKKITAKYTNFKGTAVKHSCLQSVHKGFPPAPLKCCKETQGQHSAFYRQACHC